MKKRDGEKKEKERKEMKEPAVRKLKRKKKDDGKIKEEGIEKRKQVTRGHNFVADGWAGASNPHPHVMPHHQHAYPPKNI